MFCGGVLYTWPTAFTYEKGSFCFCIMHWMYAKVQQDTLKRQRYTHTKKKCNHVHLHTHSHSHTQVVGARRDGAVVNQWEQGYSREAGGWTMDDGCCDSMKVVSCSRTETAGHRCCCWAGRGGPGRTAARPGWSAQEEAEWRTQTDEIKHLLEKHGAGILTFVL